MQEEVCWHACSFNCGVAVALCPVSMHVEFCIHRQRTMVMLIWEMQPMVEGKQTSLMALHRLQKNLELLPAT